MKRSKKLQEVWIVEFANGFELLLASEQLAKDLVNRVKIVTSKKEIVYSMIKCPIIEDIKQIDATIMHLVNNGTFIVENYDPYSDTKH